MLFSLLPLSKPLSTDQAYRNTEESPQSLQNKLHCKVLLRFLVSDWFQHFKGVPGCFLFSSIVDVRNCLFRP